MDNLLLMHEDTKVLEFNIDTGYYQVFTPTLIPWTLKGRLLPVKQFHSILTEEDYLSNQRAFTHNRDALVGWLSNRVLSLSRQHAKKLFEMLGVNQFNDNITRATIALKCRAVSVLDNYWLKRSDSNDVWKSVNIRRVSLNEIITQVALHGVNLSLTGSLNTPEYTTLGSYAKGWRRHEDNRLWLYKLGHNGDYESETEVMISRLIRKMPVRSCLYESGYDEGKYIARCPCISNDMMSIAPAIDIQIYCAANKIDFKDYVLSIDPESIYKMLIIDYLINNCDRHANNWGFYYMARTMKLIGCHPLFDHNEAFPIKHVDSYDKNKLSFLGMNLRDSALYSRDKVDFYLKEEVTRQDFNTDKQFAVFMSRALELDIKVRR